MSDYQNGEVFANKLFKELSAYDDLTMLRCIREMCLNANNQLTKETSQKSRDFYHGIVDSFIKFYDLLISTIEEI